MNVQPRNNSPRTAHLSAIVVIAAALFATGCSEFFSEFEQVTDDCTPGRVAACFCPDGSTGAQMCLDDGESYGACACGGASATSDGSGASALDGSGSGASTDGYVDISGGPDTWGDDTTDTSSTDPWSTPSDDSASADDTTPEPQPLPDPDVELRSARMHVFVVGTSLTAAIEADWSVTGRDDVVVDIEVLSNLTYRAWTTIASNLPPVYFTEVSLPVTQGESRFDVRVVARDGSGNRWTSNTITIQ